MRTRRLLVFLMIVVQAIVVRFQFDHVLFPALATAVAFVGLWGRVQFKVTRQRQLVLILLLAAGAFGYWFFLQPYSEDIAVVLTSRAGYPIAAALLALQVCQLFLRHPTGMPSWLPLSGAGVMACAGDRIVRGLARSVYQGGTLSFVALVAAFFACSKGPRYIAPASRRPRYAIASSAVILVAVLMGWITGVTLHRHRDRIDAVLIKMVLDAMAGESAGFSSNTSVKLGDVVKLKRAAANMTALRVICREQPGYLRATICDTYAEGKWSVGAKSTPLFPRDPPPDSLLPLGPGENAFVLPSTDDSRWVHMDVWPNIYDQGSLFARLSPSAVAAAANRLQMDENDGLQFMGGNQNPNYHVYMPAHPDARRTTPPSEDHRKRLTTVPEALDPRIRQLADRLFEGRTTATAKILVAINYFRGNYQYQFGIRIPKRHDPLTYFFLERPPAHCEYFAAGAAILLRLGGVPCRYVAGFVVTERAPFGGYWIARNKDAHAWVEAYDDRMGWTTVEATPTEGVPGAGQIRKPGVVSKLWDGFRFQIAQLKAVFAQAGFQGLGRRLLRTFFSALRQLVSTVPTLAVILCSIVYFAIRRFRAPRKPGPRPVDPTVAVLARLLNQMDRHVKRGGITRPPSETLHQFATRLTAENPGDDSMRQAADWYEAYAVVRYGRPPEEADVEMLRGRLPLHGG